MRLQIGQKTDKFLRTVLGSLQLSLGFRQLQLQPLGLVYRGPGTPPDPEQQNKKNAHREGFKKHRVILAFGLCHCKTFPTENTPRSP